MPNLFLKSRHHGFIDPATLITLGVLLVTILGTAVATRVAINNTEDRSQASSIPCQDRKKPACSGCMDDSYQCKWSTSRDSCIKSLNKALCGGSSGGGGGSGSCPSGLNCCSNPVGPCNSNTCYSTSTLVALCHEGTSTGSTCWKVVDTCSGNDCYNNSCGALPPPSGDTVTKCQADGSGIASCESSVTCIDANTIAYKCTTTGGTTCWQTSTCLSGNSCVNGACGNYLGNTEPTPTSILKPTATPTPVRTCGNQGYNLCPSGQTCVNNSEQTAYSTASQKCCTTGCLAPPTSTPIPTRTPTPTTKPLVPTYTPLPYHSPTPVTNHYRCNPNIGICAIDSNGQYIDSSACNRDCQQDYARLHPSPTPVPACKGFGGDCSNAPCCYGTVCLPLTNKCGYDPFHLNPPTSTPMPSPTPHTIPSVYPTLLPEPTCVPNNSICSQSGQCCSNNCNLFNRCAPVVIPTPTHIPKLLNSPTPVPVSTVSCGNHKNGETWCDPANANLMRYCDSGKSIATVCDYGCEDPLLGPPQCKPSDNCYGFLGIRVCTTPHPTPTPTPYYPGGEPKLTSYQPPPSPSPTNPLTNVVPTKAIAKATPTPSIQNVPTKTLTKGVPTPSPATIFDCGNHKNGETWCDPANANLMRYCDSGKSIATVCDYGCEDPLLAAPSCKPGPVCIGIPGIWRICSPAAQPTPTPPESRFFPQTTPTPTNALENVLPTQSLVKATPAPTPTPPPKACNWGQWLMCLLYAQGRPCHTTETGYYCESAPTPTPPESRPRPSVTPTSNTTTLKLTSSCNVGFDASSQTSVYFFKLSWNSVPSASSYHVIHYNSNLGYLKETYWATSFDLNDPYAFGPYTVKAFDSNNNLITTSNTITSNCPQTPSIAPPISSTPTPTPPIEVTSCTQAVKAELCKKYGVNFDDSGTACIVSGINYNCCFNGISPHINPDGLGGSIWSCNNLPPTSPSPTPVTSPAQSTYFTQTNSAWASNPMGNDQFWQHGCGFTVMADILHNYSDPSWDPWKVYTDLFPDRTNGITYLDMQPVLNSLGLDMENRKVSMSTFTEYFTQTQNSQYLGVIVTNIPNSNAPHLTLLTNVNAATGIYHLADPYYGPLDCQYHSESNNLNCVSTNNTSISLPVDAHLTVQVSKAP